jgi:DNA-binding transcriptional LysR family regulator
LLRTFAAVARLGSFSAAAAELGYTQAAVSQQIAALESDLKVTLLNRRPVAPTEAGARLLEHAEPILVRLDAARADVTRMTLAPRASLGVGLTPLAGAFDVVALALAALRRQMPRVDLSVRVGSREDVATAVARGELDAGLVDGLSAPGDALPVLVPDHAVGVAESAVFLVMPADHPLAGRAGVRLADLVDARWIEAADLAPPLSEVRRFAGADGFRAAFSYGGTDTLSLIRLAAAGHGLTLLPGAVLPLTTLPATVDPVAGRVAGPVAGSGFSAVPVTEPRLLHRVELVHGTLRTGSAAAVLAGLISARG